MITTGLTLQMHTCNELILKSHKRSIFEITAKQDTLSKWHKTYYSSLCDWNKEPCQRCECSAGSSLWDAAAFVWNIFVFPEMLVALKSHKMPNHTNTWSHSTDGKIWNAWLEQIWKIPNHWRYMTKRCKFPAVTCHSGNSQATWARFQKKNWIRILAITVIEALASFAKRCGIFPTHPNCLTDTWVGTTGRVFHLRSKSVVVTGEVFLLVSH